MKTELVLRQTFERSIDNPWEWDGGAKRIFDWRIEQYFSDGKVRIGCFAANHYFEVAQGRSDKEALRNALFHLRANTMRRWKPERKVPCTFAYVEVEKWE